MATITLKNLRGGYLEAAFGLTVADREFVVLTGAAGSGASQIVRLIAGLEEISEGEILFDDQRVNEVPAKDRDVAFLSRDYTPYPRMCVSENLAIALERRKFADTEIKKRVAAVAETLDLQVDLEGKPESLSPEKQRFLGLARTMARQPKVFLFDEPFAGLDRGASARGRAAIAALRQRSSATILYATSDPAEALGFGARTIIIDAGSVQQDGDASTIFEAPADLSVARFFGDPAMNLVQGNLKRERDSVVFREKGDGTITIRWPAGDSKNPQELSDGPVMLGFHVHAVDLASRSGTSGRSDSVFRALVDRAEPKGAATDVYLRTGEHELICRSRRWGASHQAGHRFEFEIDLARTRLFDGISGRLLTAGR